MRARTLILGGLLILVQLPLWFGKGGWLRVWELERQIAGQSRLNVEAGRRNASLAAEVQDLKEGAGAVEERARYELGMIKPGELFVQIRDGSSARPPPSPAATANSVVPPKLETAAKEHTPSGAKPTQATPEKGRTTPAAESSTSPAVKPLVKATGQVPLNQVRDKKP